MDADLSKEQAAIQEIDVVLKQASDDITAALTALARLHGLAGQLRAIVGGAIDNTNRRTDASLGTSAR